MTGKDAHMSLSDRQIIETGIANGSSKKSIADIIGKNKSTITREIHNHRILKKQCTYPIDCVLFPKCKDKNTFLCNKQCQNYTSFHCARRDRSPGACNGCSSYRSCHFDKYWYDVAQAHHEYRDDLVQCRAGVNATIQEIRLLGEIIKPCLEKGQSLYATKQAHPEITVTEQTLHLYRRRCFPGCRDLHHLYGSETSGFPQTNQKVQGSVLSSTGSFFYERKNVQ